MDKKYVRICPVCATSNPAARLVCACGAALDAVDFSLEIPAAAPPAPGAEAVPPAGEPTPAPAAVTQRCPHADCGQPNPLGETRCLYCNRPLQAAAPPPETPDSDARYRLPGPLRAGHRLLEVLPTRGSEADLLLVETLPPAKPEQRIVKLYRKGIQPDSALLERIAQAEARHVVRLHGHGQADGFAYELMEYCPHGNLRALLESGPLSRERIRLMVREIGAAIAEIHARHILHRDLKPENILLRTTQPLDLVLSDFGTASLHDATMLFTGIAHTAKYAAPEALTGVLDEKADWWSLGMMVLEAAAGQHPFAGLSEQVVHHRLATASVDVRGVFDDDLRKLCRGLLLRDPRRRWGRNEVARWANGDATLPDPGDDVRPAGPVVPYRIGQAQCASAVELALALAKHWEDALKDLKRGAVASWLENQLHDHNLLRKLADAMEERGLSDDLRLLRFIRAAAPDMPAVWRGKLLDRASLTGAARLALDGNEAALDWLESLAAEPVLAECAATGAADLQAIDTGWRDYRQQFVALWERAHQAEEGWRTTPKSHGGENGAYLNFDDAVYSRPLRIALPARRNLNPHLLLALFDPARVEAQRNRIIAALGEIAAYCTWFGSLGDPADMAPGGVLAMERLLAYAQEDAAAEKERLGESERSRALNLRLIRTRLETALREITGLFTHHGLHRDNLRDLRLALDRFNETANGALGFGYSEREYRTLREEVERLLRFALHLEQSLNRLERVEQINAIFFRPYRLSLAAAILLSLYSALPSAMPVWIAGAGIAGFLALRLRAARTERKQVEAAWQRFEKRITAFHARE